MMARVERLFCGVDMWIRTEDGNWYNLDHVKQLYIGSDHGKEAIFGVTSICCAREKFVWKSDFESYEEAQAWLDEQMRKL